MSQSSTPRRIDLACPNCHRPLRARTNGGFRCCDVEYPVTSSVINFIGNVGRITADASEARLARQVFDLAAERAARDATWREAGWNRVTDGLDEALVREGRLTRAEVDNLALNTTFDQIVNDLGRYLGDRAQVRQSVEFLRSLRDIGPDSVVLDAGCSAGLHLLELSETGAELIGVDMSIAALHIGDEAWRRTQSTRPPTWCCGDILNLPVEDATLSHLVSFGTFSLTPIRATLRETMRVLRPEGRLLIVIEGTGLWRDQWDRHSWLSRKKLEMGRRWLGRKLLEQGLDWQEKPVLRKLSAFTQYRPEVIERFVAEAGFVVDGVKPLTYYRGEPRQIGIFATKPG